jgi:NDP-sugar pyrophosphorylase family protein
MKPASRRLARLRGMVMLSGAVRACGFASTIGRSLLDLPVDRQHTLLDLWQAHAAFQVAHAGLERLDMRIVCNGTAPKPRPRSQTLPLAVQRDPRELRGTGGVVRDVVNDYDDEDVVAIVNANQIMDEALPHLLGALAATGADVSVLDSGDGASGGLILASCGALRAIPSIGFIDLKEQGLPMMARRHGVAVVKRPQATAWPVRTARDYIEALRRYHRRSDQLQDEYEVFVEELQPRFSIVESGAQVDSSARIHDSVVLAGAQVEPGAVVARSVIGPGAIVRRGRTAVDQLIAVN